MPLAKFCLTHLGLVILLFCAANGFECGGNLCSDSSSCCVNNRCGTKEECQPFYVILLPIVALFIVALIVGCIFVIMKKRRHMDAAQEPLVAPPVAVKAHPAVHEIWHSKARKN